MVKKDKKSKVADKKARVAAKTEKKTTQKEKKASKKPNKNADDSDAESEADLDAVLAEYAKQQEAFLKVSEVVSQPPSARASATLIGSPVNDNELFLFGGEYFNGQHARFWNDLFIYNINRDEWKLVTSPNSPLPRSGHSWTRGGNDRGVYIFGGEFSSPKQGTFYHYNDFWRLEPSTREWSKLEVSKKGGPPARSGHRLTYFKNYIILFGGFQDTSQQTKYLADLWLYNTDDYSWHQPVLPLASAKPDARSSFSFLPHEQGAVMYGGYSRVKTAAVGNKGSKGGGGGGGSGPQHAVLKPMVHQDTWFLRITPPPVEAPPNTLPTVRWERRKRPANPPAPTRAGATMAYHRGRGLQFGGVHDVEESEEGIDSEFFNTLFALNIERNRYFSLGLRRPRAALKKQTQGDQRGGGRRGRGKADEEDLLRNLAALEMKGSVGNEDGEAQPTPDEADEEEKDAAPEKPVLWEMPHPRFNAQLAVQDDVLYIFGGTYEKGDREYTFDEMYAIDLGKLDGVKEIFRREPEDWQGSDDEDDSDDDEEDEDDSDDANSDAETDDKTAHPSTPTTNTPDLTDDTSSTTTEETASTSPSALTDDGLPHPRPFETLRAFFTRTNNAWQDILLTSLKYVHSPDHKTIKELRKDAFEMAEAKWWDCREEIRVLEDEAEEAGIGEVVSLEDKSGAGGGGGAGAVGRRR